MKKKDYYLLMGCSFIAIAFIFILTPTNYLFGSHVDWLSQHSTLPQYFRSLFYESGNLFPDFAPALGAGQNIYAFSYYGLFRFDVLISYLLPFINMKTIIISYMVISYVASIDLCYIWLKKNNFKTSICLLACALLACSTLLFQSHRQIMFVNYMPWLFLALLAIDYYLKSKKSSFLILCILQIILHSYFFSISAIIVCCIYYLYKTSLSSKVFISKNRIKHLKFIGSIFIAILITSILLVPTALVMLEHARSVNSSDFSSLINIDFSLKGVLYQEYGCGLSILAWIALLYSLNHKKTRVLSLLLILSISLPLVVYCLNGTLYIRTKILIPFLPLFLYIVASSLNDINLEKAKKAIWIIPFIFIPFLFNKQPDSLILYDCLFTIFILYCFIAYKKQIILCLLFIPSLLVCINTNSLETYVNKKEQATIENKTKNNFVQDNLKEDTRFSDLSNPLSNTNYIYKDMKKTTSYSSITNSEYNSFYYDIMKNPIRIKNRVAQVASSNIFFNAMMNVQYLYSENQIPIGYTPYAYKKKGMMLENKDVLPLAYFSSDTLNEANFDKLSYPYTIDTVYNNTIVKDSAQQSYQSNMVEENPRYNVVSKDSFLSINNINNEYQIKATKNSHLTLELENLSNEKILLLSFHLKDIKDKDKKNTTITINGIKNKLSNTLASYPNKNNTFHYILSSNEDIKQLNITFSKGSYTLEKTKIYSFDYKNIQNRFKKIISLNQKNKGLLSGDIHPKEDGYFVTSLPYQKGFHIKVDNHEIKYEKVNKAFVGFKLNKGYHQISIDYKAPGKNLGMLLSIIGILCFLMNFIKERRKKDE